VTERPTYYLGARAGEVRRLRRVAFGIGVLLLAGCTAIPTGGAVHAGAQNNANAGAAPVRVPAQGPVPGEAPDQIVSNFRLASADSADIGIARAYLADPTWQPDQGVRVVDEPTQFPSYTSSGDHAKVHFVDNWIGTIAPDGTYQPQKAGMTVDYTYELTKDAKSKGQWRIVNPPSYLVLTENWVEDFYYQGYVYFLSPRNQLLVPIRVFVPVTATDKATELIYQLLQGPPAWLAQAGVTTAIPPGSAVTSVSQSNGVVTVNLSAEAANLNPVERDEMSAQIVYTLQGFGSGQFRIEAAGQPVTNSRQVALQTTKTWGAYDPDSLRVSSFYYTGDDHKTHDASGVAVPGDTGSGAVSLMTPVVAPKLANAAGGDLIAGVSSEGSSEGLYVGPLAHPKRVDFGASFTTPSWDAFGNVWTVRQPTAASPQQVMVSAVTQAGTTNFVPVDSKELAAAGDVIETLKVSRDGTRVAVIARSATAGPQLLVGHVVKSASGESIGGFYPVAPSLTPVADGVVWASAATLQVLATAPGASNPTVWSVDVDGWRPVQLSATSDVVSIARAPNQPLVIGTKNHQIEIFRNDFWQVVGTGTNPSYPC
jgi:hypothetical protein